MICSSRRAIVAEGVVRPFLQGFDTPVTGVARAGSCVDAHNGRTLCSEIPAVKRR
jgi:hypothetical protein